MTRAHGFAALTLTASVLGLIALDMQAALAQQHSCVAYQRPDYRGESWGLAANKSTGKSHISNKISGFKIRSGCYVQAYAGEDYTGRNRRFSGDTPYVGDAWNDVISSWRCICSNL